MSGNGQHGSDVHAALHWTGRVFSADDVRCRLNGHRELVVSTRTIVTPLAADDLRARGVRIVRCDEPKASANTKSAWGYAQDRPSGVVQSAVQALGREGHELR